MEDDKCLGFVDAYKKGKLCGERIFSIDEISFDSTVVISIINPFVSCDIYMLLRSKGIRKIYWYKEYLYLYNRTGDFWGSCIDCSDWGENVLPHGEIHVIDKCNLNCHGCMQFCPLYYGEKDQPTLESCTSTLKMLKEKVTSIAHFSILGGEPLLAPNLKDYIQMVRKLFPETEITLTTNGLLIPDAADELMECIKHYNLSGMIWL